MTVQEDFSTHQKRSRRRDSACCLWVRQPGLTGAGARKEKLRNGQGSQYVSWNESLDTENEPNTTEFVYPSKTDPVHPVALDRGVNDEHRRSDYNLKRDSNRPCGNPISC